MNLDIPVQCELQLLHPIPRREVHLRIYPNSSEDGKTCCPPSWSYFRKFSGQAYFKVPGNVLGNLGVGERMFD